MSLRERFLPSGNSTVSDSDGDTEQLATTVETDVELEPKGEQRQSSGGLFGYFRADRDETPYTRASGVGTDITIAPEHLDVRYHQYVRTVPLVYSPLSIFGDAVTEPGWTVEAKDGDETDEEMTEALELWGQNCAVHAQEPGKDIITIVGDIPQKRRGKGTLFYEKVRDSDGNLAGLMALKPSTMSTFARKDQPILVQPDDDVPADHPTTDGGKAAAYVQYHNDRDDFEDETQVEFTVNDVLKITFNERDGSAWGTPLWVTIREHVDGLYQKVRDRNTSIRINGHPWRVIQNEHWDEQQAQSFLKAHFKGDFSTWLSDLIPSGSERKRGPHDKKDRENTFAGRVDAVPHNLEIDEYAGDVPDIADAVMDDIQNIFSVMPVSRFKIAYEEKINQFVVEPQDQKDERNVVKERHVIREAIEPVFQEKADELAGGDYSGEVTWKLEQPTDENPLERESFDADAFATFVEAGNKYQMPPKFFEWVAGVDREEFDPEWNPDELELNESDEQVQQQFEAGQEDEGDEESDDGPEDDTNE